MTDPELEPQEPAPENEFQDAHYHDDDLDIERDDLDPRPDHPHLPKKQTRRPPSPRRRFVED